MEELPTEPNPEAIELTAIAEGAPSLEPTTEEETRFGSDLADLFGLTTRQAAAATADLEGADLLAKALREMFPPIDAGGTSTAGVAPDDNLPVFDFEAAAAAFDAVLDALPEPDDGVEDEEGGDADDGPEIAGDSEEAQRRRSRRGRRGGRGRRRNGLVMLPSPADGEPVATEPLPIRPDLSASPPALPPPDPYPGTAGADSRGARSGGGAVLAVYSRGSAAERGELARSAPAPHLGQARAARNGAHRDAAAQAEQHPFHSDPSSGAPACRALLAGTRRKRRRPVRPLRCRICEPTSRWGPARHGVSGFCRFRLGSWRRCLSSRHDRLMCLPRA